MDAKWIKECVLSGNYELTIHAEYERQADKISLKDMETALLNGEIIEHYPEDPRGVSCLVLGYTGKGEPLHIVCGTSKFKTLRLITIYVPTPLKWETPRIRRKP